MNNRHRYTAESIGTFALLFAASGSAVVNDVYGGALGLIGVSVAPGLMVMAMIYSIGNVSGAHINPAVTIAFFLARRLDGKLVLPYLGCQFAGAIAACVLLRILFPEHESLGGTMPSGTWWQAFITEVVLSFLLMFVILNVSTGHMEKGIMAGVAVGGTVAMEIMIGGPITGASMNPARSLGPALVSGQLSSLWIYLLAPILGMALAYPSCRLVQGEKCCDDTVEIE